MKKTIAVLGLLLLASISFSQESLKQTVRGTVFDQDAQYPIIGVTVILRVGELKLGAISDEQGKFKIENVPVGRHDVQFSYVNYKTALKSNVLVTSNKEVVIEVWMEEDLAELATVVVRANADIRKPLNEMASVSARTLSMEETSKFSGTLADVSRMAQNFAGVSGATDDRNDIIVRGNSPSGVLWKLEGLDIPSPNHWSTLGTTGGPISMLNANSLNTSDFISGAFPAEYGNANAAVFDLRLRNGNSEKMEYLGQIGFNGFEVGIEGPLPIGKSASFIANYRYSTLGVFSLLGVDFGTGSAVPQYQDLNFKFNIPTEKAGTFKLWGLAGISEIEFLASPDEDNLFSESDENLLTGAKTGIIGFGHKYFFNNKTFSNINIGLAHSESYVRAEELRDTMSPFQEVFNVDNFQDKLVMHWSINHKQNARNKYKVGVMYDLFDLGIKSNVLLNDDSTWYAQSDFEGQVPLYRAYGQWQHKFSNKLKMNVGSHFVYFDLSEEISVEPRFGLSFDATSKSSFSIGYGRHSQMQPLPVYFMKNASATDVENEANEKLKLAKSHHLAAAWDYLITKNMRLKTEVYYQDLSSIAVDPKVGEFSTLNFGAGFGFENQVGLVNEGTGTNYGLEITAERFLNNGFYALSTLSVFQSEYEGYDKITRNTFYNSNYVFNILAGKEIAFSEKFTLSFNGKVNVAGGRRYTPIDLEASKLDGSAVYDTDNFLESQFLPYIRPDFKIGFQHNAKKYSQRFSVDLQNVIFRQNEFSKGYNEVTEEITTVYQRGFFPDVRYQIFF